MIAKTKKTILAGYTLALRNIKIQMREHVLGYAWVLIIPMLYAVCYIFIKRELTGSADSEGVEAGWGALRAFTGITLFQFWMQVVQAMSDLIRKQKGMLRGLNITTTPFVLAVVFEGVVALSIRAVLIIIAVPLIGLTYPHDLLSWILFFSGLLGLLLSATAIGLMLAPWSALYADIKKALSSVTLPILLISPVFYAAVKNTDSWLFWINSFNPIASPLAIIADVFQGNDYSLYIIPMMIWIIVSVIIITWSLIVLRNQMPILLERLGN